MEKRFRGEKDLLLNDPAFREVFAPSGKIPSVGDIVYRTRFADTLETIANDGADAFYAGSIAKEIVKEVQKSGGILTMADMKQYQAKLREPLIGYYHGRRVITGPPPTSGPILLSVLNIIERYNFALTGPTALNMHRMVEAFKFGYAQRTELGDPDYLNITERIEEFISKEHAGLIRHNISDVSSALKSVERGV
jgi:gamma-glutamyltranspeptidase/glutathione hydrolase/leukotriene-C4 hydrolase